MGKIKSQQVALCNAIIDKCTKMNVEPQHVLEVLGGGIIKVLITISDPLGYDYNELIQAFADGLKTADIKFKQQT